MFACSKMVSRNFASSCVGSADPVHEPMSAPDVWHALPFTLRLRMDLVYFPCCPPRLLNPNLAETDGALFFEAHVLGEDWPT